MCDLPLVPTHQHFPTYLVRESKYILYTGGLLYESAAERADGRVQIEILAGSKLCLAPRVFVWIEIAPLRLWLAIVVVTEFGES